MSDYRLTFKPTKAERVEIVTRHKKMAADIADKMEAGEQLADHERDFADFMLREGSGDDVAAIREWSRNYSPKRSRGQQPLYSHTVAAMDYTLNRQGGLTHYKTMLILAAKYGVNSTALERVIWPLLPDVCAHLGIDPKLACWRDEPPK